MSTEAWPTIPIARGTGSLMQHAQLPTPSLEAMNAANPERRLIAGVALAAIVVCVPSVIILALRMPNPDLAAVGPPPPINVVMVTPLPAVAKPSPVVAKPVSVPPIAAVAAPATPSAASSSAPAVASSAKLGDAKSDGREDIERAKKALKKRKAAQAQSAKAQAQQRPAPVPVDIEIWPAPQKAPQDVRLAAPPPPGGDDDLKRPVFESRH